MILPKEKLFLGSYPLHRIAKHIEVFLCGHRGVVVTKSGRENTALAISINPDESLRFLRLSIFTMGKNGRPFVNLLDVVQFSLRTEPSVGHVFHNGMVGMLLDFFNGNGGLRSMAF